MKMKKNGLVDFFLLFLYDFKDPGHLVYSMVTQSVASLRVTTCTG